MKSILDEIRYRFGTAREKANGQDIIAPHSYGAGYDRGYSDALGEMIEWIEDQMGGVCERCGGTQADSCEDCNNRGCELFGCALKKVRATE